MSALVGLPTSKGDTITMLITRSASLPAQSLFDLLQSM